MGNPLPSVYHGQGSGHSHGSRTPRVAQDASAYKRSPIRRKNKPSYMSSQPRIRPRRFTRPSSVTCWKEPKQLPSPVMSPLPLSNAPNAPNDHVSLAPYLAALMRASVVIQVIMDRAAAIRNVIQELRPHITNMSLVEDDLCDAKLECDAVYELHAQVYKQMLELDAKLISREHNTHVRENLRSQLSRYTTRLERSTDLATDLLHQVFNRLSDTHDVCDEAVSIVRRWEDKLPFIRFLPAESPAFSDADVDEFPQLERVSAHVPVHIARPLSSTNSSQASSPNMPSATLPPFSTAFSGLSPQALAMMNTAALINSESGLGDRSRSPDIEGTQDAEVWDNMLNTLQADATLPSADSSFTSAAASASFSASDEPRSNAVVPSPRRIRFRRSAAMVADQPIAHFQLVASSATPPMRDTVSLPEANSRADSERRRSIPPPPPPPELLHPPVVPSPAMPSFAFYEQPTYQTYDPLSHPELWHMRTILMGLSQSDAIPDDWWASAGLTPYVLEPHDSTLQNPFDRSFERRRS